MRMGMSRSIRQGGWSWSSRLWVADVEEEEEGSCKFGLLIWARLRRGCGHGWHSFGGQHSNTTTPDFSTNSDTLSVRHIILLGMLLLKDDYVLSGHDITAVRGRWGGTGCPRGSVAPAGRRRAVDAVYFPGKASAQAQRILFSMLPQAVP
jgi:hypothetical protein